MDLLYAMMGAPGNIGSMDASHSPRLNKCPGSLNNQCEGKEGYPTLAWMCIVDHFKYIQYVYGVYIDRMKERVDYDSVHWSEWWESLLKDVECMGVQGLHGQFPFACKL